MKYTGAVRRSGSIVTCFILLLAVCLWSGGCGAKGRQEAWEQQGANDRQEAGGQQAIQDGTGVSQGSSVSPLVSPLASALDSPSDPPLDPPLDREKSEAGRNDSGPLPEPTAECLIYEPGKTLEERFLVPDGYYLKKREQGTLTSFLREYPLKKAGSPVLLYDGRRKGNQSAHAAVFKLPMEKEDFQQCADSVMRVYAEYFWETKQFEKISFSLGGGFQADYSKWRAGYTIRVSGDTARWAPSSSSDGSYDSFKSYLRLVFAYSGTATMEGETKKITREDIRVGDVFIKGGSPGHVVMVVEVCEREDGAKAFLLAQGYMPAQEFHVLKNPRHENDPWYYEEEVEYPFETPEYTFERGSLRRLVYNK